MHKWSQFMSITKVDAEQRIVSGIASNDSVDSQGEVVSLDAIKAALPGYLEWSNIREMHQPSAIGVAVGAVVKDGALHLDAHIVDDNAWAKVQAGVYKGFSIGGKVTNSEIVKATGTAQAYRRITGLDLHEISLVDRPANPDAKILLYKGDGMSDIEKATGDADLSKPIAGIQAARNAAELAGDLDASNLLTQAIALLLQANGDASPEIEGSPEEEAAEGDAEAAAEGDAPEAFAAAASASTIFKAGRALNAGNMSAMQSTIKSLLGMLAAAGDETATKALALYTPAPAPGAAEKGASVDDLSKAMAFALEPIFRAITDGIADVAKDVEGLKRQPRAGGPAQRIVADKQLTSQPAAPAQAEPQISKAQLEKALGTLRQLANTEADPMRRKVYADKVTELEKSLA